MHPAIVNLLSASGSTIANPVGVDECLQYLGQFGLLGKELAELLSRKNGFYAFESSLLVRPLLHSQAPLGAVAWNDPGSWKGEYIDNLMDVFFFAEDVFGGQFGIRGETVGTFDPETGAFEACYSSLADWARDLIDDRDFRTGYPLAHTWQSVHAPLQPGMRLLPKTPFVCGGQYEIDNLYSLDDLKGMLFRASIANQIRDLPEGSQVVLDVRTDQQRHT